MKPLALAIAFVLALGAISMACDQCQKSGVALPQCQQLQTVQAAPVQAVQAIPVQTTQLVPQTFMVPQTRMVAMQTMQYAVPVQAVPVQQQACATPRRGFHPVADGAARRADRVDARRNARLGGGCHGTAQVQTVAFVGAAGTYGQPVGYQVSNCNGSGGQPLQAEKPAEQSADNYQLPPTPALR